MIGRCWGHLTRASRLKARALRLYTQLVGDAVKRIEPLLWVVGKDCTLEVHGSAESISPLLYV